jgi:hypothetical protein
MSRISPYLTQLGPSGPTPQAVPLGITNRNQNIGHDIFERRVSLVTIHSPQYLGLAVLEEGKVRRSTNSVTPIHQIWILWGAIFPSNSALPQNNPNPLAQLRTQLLNIFHLHLRCESATVIAIATGMEIVDAPKGGIQMTRHGHVEIP